MNKIGDNELDEILSTLQEIEHNKNWYKSYCGKSNADNR